MVAKIDMMGRVCNDLTVLYAGGSTADGRIAWVCQCICGVRVTVAGVQLRRGAVKSCGCRKQCARRTHGKANWPEYKVWSNMIQRCKPNSPSAKNYFDKGIRVCERWRGRGGYVRFIEDMGRKPSSKHTIDRINGSRGYEPGNCRWATALEQSHNVSKNVNVTYRGVIMCGSEFARMLRVTPATVYARLRKGQTADEIAKAFSIRNSKGNGRG